MLIWDQFGYQAEPSDVLYSLNQFLGWDFFFAVSYIKPALAFGINYSFCQFLTPPLAWTVLYAEREQKQTFFDPLPPILST